MRKLIMAAAMGVIITAGGAFATDGKAIFQSKGCAACHNPTVDTVGPSLKKIAQVYAGKLDELIAFLKGQGKPHVDPAKFPIMQPQLNQLKSLSDAEIKALAEYMLSVK